MANIDTPVGARPYEGALRCTPYESGGTVYPGDIVKLNSSGKVVVGTAGAAALGVAATYASATDKEIMVWDHPDQKFEIQDDGSATLSQASVGLNFDILATAGDSSYIRSRMELAANSGATTPSTLPLRLLGFGREANSDTSTVNMKCVVLINNHQLAEPSVGV